LHLRVVEHHGSAAQSIRALHLEIKMILAFITPR
jgi:hypothetical protein